MSTTAQMNPCVELVKAALEPEPAAALSNLLECLANLFDAYGCAIWEVVPDSGYVKGNQEGELFVLASWFLSGEIFAIHDLPIKKSFVGKSLIENDIIFTNDLPNEGGLPPDHPFFQKTTIQRMLSIPVSFGDNHPAAISFFRQDRQPAYSKSDTETVKEIIHVVPHLFKAIQNKINYQLIDQINAILNRFTDKSDNLPLTQDILHQKIFLPISEALANTFSCLQATIILKDSTSPPDRYSVAATT